nr:potassium-transporting ATPase subunit KdpC [Oligella urethralis]
MLKPALLLFVVLSIILGIVYPLAMTALSQTLMPSQANGSLYKDDQGKVIGSSLIGQNFDDPKYLWGRPSAANYDAKASSGSNLGPLNPELVQTVQAAMSKLKASDPDNTAAVPLALVSASGSGLDPHISPASAKWQVNRIAKQRGIRAELVQKVIDEHTQGPQFGLFGDPVVNVLAVNMALDKLNP